MRSVNFRHELTWDPGPGTPPGTHYRVFARYSGGLPSDCNSVCVRVGLRERGWVCGGCVFILHIIIQNCMAYSPYLIVIVIELHNSLSLSHNTIIE